MLNTKQLQCVVTLSKTQSFSEAAEKLNISQPALSKQIIHLEKDIGIKLFNRETVPVTLTQAGEFFVREAEELLSREEQLLGKMKQIHSGQIGQLVIGISQFRSLYMLPEVLKMLQQRYPQVQIRVHEADSKRRLKNLEDGKYDFAVVNLPVDEAKFDAIPLKPDTLVLAVPNCHLDKIAGASKENLLQVDMAQCKDLPFVTVSKKQDLGKLFERLCVRQGVYPSVVMEVFGVATAWAMAVAGVGATILPLQFVESMQQQSNITLYSIANCAYNRQPAVVTRRGQYLPEYAKYAIELLTEKQK